MMKRIRNWKDLFFIQKKFGLINNQPMLTLMKLSSINFGYISKLINYFFLGLKELLMVSSI